MSLSHDEFDGFNGNTCCPLCKTQQDIPVILVPIDGTDTADGKVSAVPVHASCLATRPFRYNNQLGVIYTKLDK